MGIHIKCDNQIVPCSYSFIHKARKIITQMTIEYIKNLSFRIKSHPDSSLKEYFIPGPHDISQDEDIEYEEQEDDFHSRQSKVVVFLENTLSLSDEINPYIFRTTGINYFAWNQQQIVNSTLLTEFGILGIQHFVNHSDTQGFFSVGQSTDIMDLFSRIFVYKDKYI